MCMDIWHPGDTATVKHKVKHVLIATCIMTTFSICDMLNSITAKETTQSIIKRVFLVIGLPRMIIIDAGSEFAGLLKQVCDQLLIKYYTVSKGNHKAIIVERVNRYLNKIQRIHQIDTETYKDWINGIMLGIYAWNAAPIDSMDITRSFAAIGREFKLPIDIKGNDNPMVLHNNQGEQVIAHIEATFPMILKQRELLKILITKR